ncbi:MAG: 2-oxoacid:acceptor oxidoreductase subunit alpha, partial [Bdellovibrionales bacterium]
MKNLSLQIDTINGTGSLSANQILTKILFRVGWPVGSYNFFPSNIAGLACSYNLRLNSEAHTAYEPRVDLLISLDPQSLVKSLKNLKPNGMLITDEKHTDEKHKEKISFQGCHYKLPMSQSLLEFKEASPKIKILLKNILYIGLITKWLDIKEDLCQKVFEDYFKNSKISPKLLDWNLKAFLKGRELAEKHPLAPQLKTKLMPQALVKDSILIDGNTAIALGALFSGCQFLSWYPITPASSLADTFEKFANQYQKDQEGSKKFLVLQSEDEISALTQVIGAGWTGLRAMTVTSGPGLSLMNEAAGLAYFSEIPAVLCNVQRAGPSTGLPTRTQQGDLLSSCFLSHGDTSPIVLIPGNPEECFSLSQQAFDLAEELQTLIVLLSDLDLGMNLQISPTFKDVKAHLKRGKVLKESDLLKKDFARYKDEDQDGVSYRTLPGTPHPEAAYLTRGSGHNEKAEYSESPEDYSSKLKKLKRKWETAQTMMPEPIIDDSKKTSVAFVTFGNNEKAIQEVRSEWEQDGKLTNYMRVRSYPFPKSVKTFLKKHSTVFVVEQNQGAQLKTLLSKEFPFEASKLKSILQYDGRPLYPET